MFNINIQGLRREIDSIVGNFYPYFNVKDSTHENGEMCVYLFVKLKKDLNFS